MADNRDRHQPLNTISVLLVIAANSSMKRARPRPRRPMFFSQQKHRVKIIFDRGAGPEAPGPGLRHDPPTPSGRPQELRERVNLLEGSALL